MKTLFWFELRELRPWSLGLLAVAAFIPLAVSLISRLFIYGDYNRPYLVLQDAIVVGDFSGIFIVLAYLVRAHFRPRGLREVLWLSPVHPGREVLVRFVTVTAVWFLYGGLLFISTTLVGFLLFVERSVYIVALAVNVAEGCMLATSLIAASILWDRFATAFLLSRKRWVASVFFALAAVSAFYNIGNLWVKLDVGLPEVSYPDPLHVGGVARLQLDVFLVPMAIALLFLLFAWRVGREVEL